MNKNTERRIRQYNICMGIKYAGYVIIALSFLLLLSIAGESDYCTMSGIEAPSIPTMIIQFIIYSTSMYIGFKVSSFGEELVEICRRQIARLVDSDRIEVK